MESAFESALIVSVLHCGLIWGNHRHPQWKDVNCRHRRTDLQTLTADKYATSTFTTLHPAVQSLRFLNPCVRDWVHFRTQCSGMRQSTCESGDAIQGRLLFTAAHRRISKCFELTTMIIALWSKCDGNILRWETHVLVEDILSKPASMLIWFSSGQG